MQFGEQRDLQWLAERTRTMLRPRKGAERREIETQPLPTGFHHCKARRGVRRCDVTLRRAAQRGLSPSFHSLACLLRGSASPPSHP